MKYVKVERLYPYFKNRLPQLPRWLVDDESIEYQLFCLFYLFEADYPLSLLREEVWNQWCLLYEKQLLEELETIRPCLHQSSQPEDELPF